MTTKKRIRLYTIPLGFLSIPFVTGFLTKEVNWSVNDFIIAGVLLFTTAFTVDFILSKVKNERSAVSLHFINPYSTFPDLGGAGRWHFRKSIRR